MKRIITLFAVILLLSTAANAYDFKVGGLCYNYNADGESVTVTKERESTGYIGDSYVAYIMGGTLTIPSSVTYSSKNYTVTSIGNSAFYGCDITSVTIPNTVTSIGNSAFYKCSFLTSIEIPNSVTSIGNSAFEGTQWYNSQPNGLVYAGNVAYKYKTVSMSGAITIKDGTIGIADNCFYNLSGLASIEIPSTVITIGSHAFYNCRGLTSVTIPNSVTSIGYEAFYGCSGLTSIIVPNSVATIGENAFSGTQWYNSQPDGLVYAGNVAYKYKGTMPSGTSITLIDGTLGITARCFYNCAELTSVTIPNSVTSIGDYALYGCSGLTSVTIPNSVTSIGQYAFYGCSGLNKVEMSDIEAWCRISFGISSSNPLSSAHHLYLNDEEICDLVIPNTITAIKAYSFSGCSGLTSVTIPNSVTSIGNSAFSGCSGLTGNLTIPNSVTSIGNSAFSGCSGLTGNLAIPNSVTSIGNYAFKGCSGLTGTLTIPNSITEIAEYTFSQCRGLTSVAIGSFVKSIGSSAFYYCTGLTSVEIPRSVTEIGEKAFYGCGSLAEVINLRNTPQSLKTSDTFEGVNLSTARLCVPVGSIEAYGEAFLWRNFGFITGLPTPSAPVFSPDSGAYNGPSTVTISAENGAEIRYTLDGSDPTAESTLYSSPIVLDEVNTTTTIKAIAIKYDNISEVASATYTIIPRDRLYLNDMSFVSGETKTFAIQLDNETTMIACDFRMQLPEGFSIAKDEDDYYLAELVAARSNRHSLEVEYEGNGTYHFIGYSNRSNAFVGNSGDFITVSIAADKNAPSGNYQGELKNIVFFDAESNHVNLINDTFNIETVYFAPGDANNDGSLNVMDIVETVAYIMGNPSASFVFESADLDGNGVVNVMDLVNLVGMVMASANQTSALSIPIANNNLNVFGIDKNAVTVYVPEAKDYIAAQFTVELKDGDNLFDVVTDGDHIASFRPMDDGRYLVVIYSNDNSRFVGNEPIRLKVGNAGNVKINNVMFVDADRNAVAYEAAESNGTLGVISIEADFSQPVDIYNLNGQLIRKNARTVKGLDNGIYIINNKKVYLR